MQNKNNYAGFPAPYLQQQLAEVICGEQLTASPLSRLCECNEPRSCSWIAIAARNLPGIETNSCLGQLGLVVAIVRPLRRLLLSGGKGSRHIGLSFYSTPSRFCTPAHRHAAPFTNGMVWFPREPRRAWAPVLATALRQKCGFLLSVVPFLRTYRCY